MSLVLESCPACGEDKKEFVETISGFEMLRCLGCGLEYTRNPQADVEGYAESYRGEPGVLKDSRPYLSPAARLSLEEVALFRPSPYLTAAERWVSERISQMQPRARVVLDVGCGSGRFVRALRRRGYDAYGVETVDALVKTLQNMGLPVTQAKLPGLKWTGPNPDAVTLFEVLEHVPDPRLVLWDIRKQFPHAALGISVPSPARVELEQHSRSPTDYPPNHYLRWTLKALDIALRSAGYRRVEVVAPQPRGSEFAQGTASLVPEHILRRLRHVSPSADESGVPDVRRELTAAHRVSDPRRVAATALLIVHRHWHFATDLIYAPRARAAAQRGRSSASLAAWAEP